MKFKFMTLFLGLLLLSCKDNSQKEKITALVKEWQGKQIKFPKDPTFTKYVTDTTDFQIPTKGHKVLIYVDSLGCTSCKLQLAKWKEFIAYTDSATGGNVPFLFFIHSKNVDETKYLLKIDEFDYPICIDDTDQLNKLNTFPSNSIFQTFLLDADNKVVVLGNPIHNLSVKELYIKEITGKHTKQTAQQKTTAIADQTVFDLGKFALDDEKKSSFTLTNTGDFPLVIQDILTTCDCMDITFEKHPIHTKEKLTVSIVMKGKEKGFFSKTVTVYANTNKPIKIQIKGYVQ